MRKRLDRGVDIKSRLKMEEIQKQYKNHGKKQRRDIFRNQERVGKK